MEYSKHGLIMHFTLLASVHFEVLTIFFCFLKGQLKRNFSMKFGREDVKMVGTLL